MTTAKPFSWIVRFTVAPVWVQDGFSLCDTRAFDMLANELPYANTEELQAAVLEAPSPLAIARMQGYSPKDGKSGELVRELRDGVGPECNGVRNALMAARKLLDSVAFVSQPGDTEKVLAMIDSALDSINTRRGDAVEIEV